MVEELNEIIRYPYRKISVEFASLKTEEAKSWVRTALHSVRIYTGELDGDRNMTSAIKVFERECVGIILDIDREAINSACNQMAVDLRDNPEAWTPAQETLLIDAIKERRVESMTNNNDKRNMRNRATQIENNTILSRARITDADAQNAAWGHFQ